MNKDPVVLDYRTAFGVQLLPTGDHPHGLFVVLGSHTEETRQEILGHLPSGYLEAWAKMQLAPQHIQQVLTNPENEPLIELALVFDITGAQSQTGNERGTWSADDDLPLAN